MRHRVKMALLLLLACVLVAGLAACGGGDDEGDGGSGGSGATTAAKELTGTITVWDIVYKAFPDSTKAADQLDDEFERLHPGVTVKHVPQPLAQYDQTLQAAFTGRKGADVIMLLPGAAGVLNWTKGLETLNDRVTPELRDSLSGWDMVSADYDADGDTYGVPVGLQGMVFYYNKRLFARAGLPTDFRPQTWEDVKEAGEKLEAAGIQAFTGGNREGYENRWWFSSGWQTVATPQQSIELALGDMSFTDPTFAAAYAPERMMQDAGLFEDDRFTAPTFSDGALRFGDGRAGMYLGLWSVAAHYGSWIDRLGDEAIGIFFAPGSRFIGAAPNWGWTIPSFSPNKDAAWEYIKFVTSRESMQTLYDVGKTLPNNSSVELAADAPSAERQLLATVEERGTEPLVENMLPGGVLFALDAQMNEVMQGRTSMDAAQQALQDTAERDR